MQGFPIIQNYTPYIGATFSDRINSITEDGVVLDISGDTFVLTMENRNGEVLHTLEIGTGIEFDGTEALEWKFTPDQTAEFVRNETMVYSILWTRSSNGDIIPIQVGEVTPWKKGINV